MGCPGRPQALRMRSEHSGPEVGAGLADAISARHRPQLGADPPHTYHTPTLTGLRAAGGAQGCGLHGCGADGAVLAGHRAHQDGGSAKKEGTEEPLGVDLYPAKVWCGLPQWLSSEESACSSGDLGDVSLIPGSGRSPGEGNGNPLQSSCLKNPMDRGAWRATVHGVTKSQTRLERLNTQGLVGLG